MAVLVAGGVVLAPALSAVTAAEAASTANVVPAATVKDSDAAVTDFGGCIAGGGTGDLLLLIDDSGSLKQSDPDDDRVKAAQYLVRQLGRFAEQSSAQVDIRVSRFSTSYSDVGGWSTLDGASVPRVSETVASLAMADTGFETDYWSALEGARKDLAERASSRKGTNCQAIAWFTDGKAEYDVRSTKAAQDAYGTSKSFAPGADLSTRAGVEAATKAANEDLCRSGGLADQLRSSGITTFAVGLESSGASASDFAQLEAIATGSSSSPNTTCGSITEPVPGSFTLASDIDNLLFAFDALSTPGQAPLTQESGICQVSYCTDQAHEFVLDDSTPAVHVLAAADVDAVDVDLVGPDGVPVRLPRGTIGTSASVAVPGGTATYTWESPSSVSVDITRSDGATTWSGLWKVVFIDPAGTSADKRSRTNVHISSDLVPTWSGASRGRVHLSSAWDGTFGIARGRDAVAPASIQGSAALSAVLSDGSGHDTTIVDGADKAHIGGAVSTEPTGLDLGAGTVEMRLALTTAPVMSGTTVVHEGTVLAPAVVRVPVSILAPEQYPVVSDTVDFGTIEGDTSGTATVTLNGSGCAWLSGKPAVAAAPSGTGPITVVADGHDQASDCVKASSGGTPMQVTLSFDESRNGTVNGTFPVSIAAADALGDPLTTNVSFTADLRRPLNQANFLLTLVVALIAGPGIPLGLLYLASFLTARMPSGGLLSQRVSVRVVEGTVLRDGEPFAFRPSDFSTMQTVSRRNARSLVVAGLSLQARPSRSPVGAGHVLAAEPGSSAVSDGSPAWVRRGASIRARLPLAVQGHWVVLSPSGSAADTAEVVAFVGTNAPDSLRASMAESVRDRLPDLLARLRAETGEELPSEDAFASADARSGSSIGFGSEDVSSAPQSAHGSRSAGRPRAGRSPSRRGDGRATPESSATPPPPAEDVGFGFGFDDPPHR